MLTDEMAKYYNTKTKTLEPLTVSKNVLFMLVGISRYKLVHGLMAKLFRLVNALDLIYVVER